MHIPVIQQSTTCVVVVLFAFDAGAWLRECVNCAAGADADAVERWRRRW